MITAKRVELCPKLDIIYTQLDIYICIYVFINIKFRHKDAAELPKDTDDVMLAGEPD